jgi:Spy/CpxP family protein refolding chaperone
MTNQTRTFSAVAVAAIVVMSAISTASGQPPAGRGQGRGFGPDTPLPMLRELNLTESQREQIKTLMGDQRSDAEQAPGRKLMDLQHQLRIAIFADSPDTAHIDHLRSAIAEAEAAALSTRIDLQLKIAQILTPEQRKQARELPDRPFGRVTHR